jgi:hypothetical protein
MVDDDVIDEDLGNKESNRSWSQRIREEREREERETMPPEYYADDLKKYEDYQRYGAEDELPPLPEEEYTSSGAKITETPTGTYQGTPQHDWETQPEEEPEFEKQAREERKREAEQEKENYDTDLTPEQVNQAIEDEGYYREYEPKEPKKTIREKYQDFSEKTSGWVSGLISSTSERERGLRKIRAAEVKRIGTNILSGDENLKVRKGAQEAMLPFFKDAKELPKIKDVISVIGAETLPQSQQKRILKEFKPVTDKTAERIRDVQRENRLMFKDRIMSEFKKREEPRAEFAGVSKEELKKGLKGAGLAVVQGVTGIKLKPLTKAEKGEQILATGRQKRIFERTKSGKGLIPSLIHGGTTGKKGKGGGSGFFGGVPSRMRFKFSERKLYPTPRKIGYKGVQPRGLWQASYIRPTAATSSFFGAANQQRGLLGVQSNILGGTITIKKNNHKKKRGRKR